MTAAARDAFRRPMPPRIATLLGAVIVFGLAVAWTVVPQYWWITPAVFGFVLYGWLTGPPADADVEARELPRPVRRRVRQTFGELPDGEAARRLREVVHLARPIFGAAPAVSTLEPLLDDCAGLVEAACDTAVELSRLEQLLTRDATHLQSRDQRDLRQSVTEAHELLASRLGDAASALGELYVQSVESGTISSDRLHELAADLSAEVSVRRRATAELEALLR